MRILILSTYPASAPDSGGVLRLRALKEALAAAGHRTHVLAVLTPHVRAKLDDPSETVLCIAPSCFSEEDFGASGYHDILSGLRCLADSALVAAAEALVRSFRPDVVLIEQPFLIGLAERLCAVHGKPLVYSAANLEAELKRDLVALVPRFYRHSDDLLSEVAAAEQRAAALSALTVAIAPGMVPSLTAWGARNVAVFGNGSRHRESAAAAAHPLAAMLGSSDFTCFGCFGSAYWPNLEGVAAILWPSLAFLPQDARLIMTGQLYRDLREHETYQRGRRINDSRLVGFDHLETVDFDALVGNCDALLLPVFVGSGSPLKTADALASGRPVLMSRIMTAGYEDVIGTCPDGVRIVDDPAAFRSAWHEWAKLGKRGLAGLSGHGKERADALKWSSRLAGFAQAVAAVA